MIGGNDLKIKNENIRSIIINIISNLIFQIILILISGSGIFYTIIKGLKSLKDNSITITILNIIILIICCILITIAIVLIFVSKRNRKNTKSKKEKNIQNIINSELPDYYFSNYEKHITVYKNGNGIIILKFTVVANDIHSLQQIRRKLNIEDGVKTAKFPSLEVMMKTAKADRFTEYGFWYEADDDLISDVKEYYWDNKTKKENKKLKKNLQELRWVFNINKNKLVKEKAYKISYAISVPGLAALRDGRLDKELLHDKTEDISFSNMQIDHRILKLQCVVSFEDGVALDTKPECKCIIGKQDGLKELDISGTEYYDIFYRKYIFNIDYPEFGSDINISWKYNEIN